MTIAVRMLPAVAEPARQIEDRDQVDRDRAVLGVVAVDPARVRRTEERDKVVRDQADLGVVLVNPARVRQIEERDQDVVVLADSEEAVLVHRTDHGARRLDPGVRLALNDPDPPAVLAAPHGKVAASRTWIGSWTAFSVSWTTFVGNSGADGDKPVRFAYDPEGTE
jgi:hypothetical protein